MAERKSIDERIAALEEREKQLKAQKRKLKAQQSQAERKARTKRLIEVGAIVEKAIDLQLETKEKREALLQLLTQEKQNRSGETYSYGSYFKKELIKKFGE